MRSPRSAPSWSGSAILEIGGRRSRIVAGTQLGVTRSANEDGVGNEGPLVMLVDGCGGTPPGVVAEAALEAGLRELEPAEALAAAGRAIYGVDFEDDWGGGATAIAARLDDRGATIAHVGDCRAWRWQAGALDPLTRDHRLVEMLVADGRMTRAEANASPHRSVLTRVLGLQPEIEVEVGRVDLAPGARLLLTSDGVHDVVDLAALVADAHPERVVAAALAAARERGHDDASLIVIDIA